MPMVVPEPLPLLLLSLQRLLQQKLIHRLHVTAAHPPSPSVQRAAPHHIPAPNLYAISGTVVYTVTDANGCTGTVTVTLTEPAAITATETHTPIACNGGTSTVTISATGGTAPYTAPESLRNQWEHSVYRYRCQWLYRNRYRYSY